MKKSWGFLLLVGWLVLPGSALAVTGPSCAMMKGQVTVARQQGAHPISCNRSLAHQERIKRYYYARKRYGQVAKSSRNSWHVRGCACDFNRRFRNTAGAFNRSKGHTGSHLSPTGR